MNLSTQAALLGVGWDKCTGAATAPIYQTATFPPVSDRARATTVPWSSTEVTVSKCAFS
jgi:hypothetical protein